MKKDKEKEILQEEKEETASEEYNKQEEYLDKEMESYKLLDEKEKKIEDLNKKMLRLQADFLNYKNRVENEKQRAYTNATEDFIILLLPTLDNFERAVSTDEEHNIIDGIKMIFNQLYQTLEKKGLKEISALGEDFNPEIHHCVMTEDAQKKADKNKIVEVLQKGYTFKDKLIRPCMVKVSK